MSQLSKECFMSPLLCLVSGMRKRIVPHIEDESWEEERKEWMWSWTLSSCMIVPHLPAAVYIPIGFNQYPWLAIAIYSWFDLKYITSSLYYSLFHMPLSPHSRPSLRLLVWAFYSRLIKQFKHQLCFSSSSHAAFSWTQSKAGDIFKSDTELGSPCTKIKYLKQNQY